MEAQGRLVGGNYHPPFKRQRLQREPQDDSSREARLQPISLEERSTAARPTERAALANAGGLETPRTGGHTQGGFVGGVRPAPRHAPSAAEDVGEELALLTGRPRRASSASGSPSSSDSDSSATMRRWIDKTFKDCWEEVYGNQSLHNANEVHEVPSGVDASSSSPLGSSSSSPSPAAPAASPVNAGALGSGGEGEGRAGRTTAAQPVDAAPVDATTAAWRAKQVEVENQRWARLQTAWWQAVEAFEAATMKARGVGDVKLLYSRVGGAWQAHAKWGEHTIVSDTHTSYQEAEQCALARAAALYSHTWTEALDEALWRRNE